MHSLEHIALHIMKRKMNMRTAHDVCIKCISCGESNTPFQITQRILIYLIEQNNKELVIS